MLSRVDTSLIDEWESMFEAADISQKANIESPTLSPYDPRVNHKAFVAKIRAELFHLVRLLAQKNYEDARLAINNNDQWPVAKFEKSLENFYSSYNAIIADPRARNPVLTKITKLNTTSYEITHTILDNQEDNMWYLSGRIDLDNQEEGQPLIQLEDISS
jgi:hypothetical protein